MTTGQGAPKKGKSKAKDAEAKKKQQADELTESDLDNVAGGVIDTILAKKKKDSLIGGPPA